MADIGKRLGKRIAELRKERGITQARLAERAAITPEHLSRIERADVAPSLTTVDAIAGGLAVEPKALFDFGSRATQDPLLTQLLDIARQATPDERRLMVRLAEAVVANRKQRR